MPKTSLPQDGQKVKLPKTVTLTVQYHASHRYLRGGGEIVEVQVDGQDARTPRNGFTDPDAAGRYLEARGYQFVPAESVWLDRLGTTFQPKRKQVFHREEVTA